MASSESRGARQPADSIPSPLQDAGQSGRRARWRIMRRRAVISGSVYRISPCRPIPARASGSAGMPCGELQCGGPPAETATATRSRNPERIEQRAIDVSLVVGRRAEARGASRDSPSGTRPPPACSGVAARARASGHDWSWPPMPPWMAMMAGPSPAIAWTVPREVRTETGAGPASGTMRPDLRSCRGRSSGCAGLEVAQKRCTPSAADARSCDTRGRRPYGRPGRDRTARGGARHHRQRADGSTTSSLAPRPDCTAAGSRPTPRGSTAAGCGGPASEQPAVVVE